jgi:hypothetical protein
LGRVERREREARMAWGGGDNLVLTMKRGGGGARHQRHGRDRGGDSATGWLQRRSVWLHSAVRGRATEAADRWVLPMDLN